jgi:EAL domain-containing protein (putative c-di-GMP-specific phosphodiesterase class I)
LSSGATIGGAIFPQDAATANDLFNVADTALYALKTDGRGGTRLFHSRMREESRRVASQLNLARLAIRDCSLVPFFQPKIDLKSGQLVGFEALLRWRDGARGFQLPQTIEEAFKEYELASEIGALMQRRVFEHIREWLDQGVNFGRISLNGAPAEFLRDDYAERLLLLLAQYDIPASFIEVEVTEHALMDRSSRYVERALTMLKRAGVTVALDDFGTGYSSLSHLRDFPVDVVKVDKSFVQAINSDSEIAAIVGAVINLASSLEMQSVAEGIETEQQLTLLRTMGCQVGQGYALGAPIAGDEVTISRAAKAA